MVVLNGNFAVGCGPVWNGLPLNTYISIYARTNRCYNERRSRTNYVRSSIPHCTWKRTSAISSQPMTFQRKSECTETQELIQTISIQHWTPVDIICTTHESFENTVRNRLKKSNSMQEYTDIYLLLNCCTCFGRPSRPSSAVHETVVTVIWSRLKKLAPPDSMVCTTG